MREIAVIFVWLRNEVQFSSMWQSPALQPWGSSISYCKFSLRDEPHKSLLGFWGVDCQSSVTSLVLTQDSLMLPSLGHGALALFYKGALRWLSWLFPHDLLEGVAVISLGDMDFCSTSSFSCCKYVVIWRRQNLAGVFFCLFGFCLFFF